MPRWDSGTLSSLPTGHWPRQVTRESLTSVRREIHSLPPWWGRGERWMNGPDHSFYHSMWSNSQNTDVFKQVPVYVSIFFFPIWPMSSFCHGYQYIFPYDLILKKSKDGMTGPSHWSQSSQIHIDCIKPNRYQGNSMETDWMIFSFKSELSQSSCVSLCLAALVP